MWEKTLIKSNLPHTIIMEDATDFRPRNAMLWRFLALTFSCDLEGQLEDLEILENFHLKGLVPPCWFARVVGVSENTD